MTIDSDPGDRSRTSQALFAGWRSPRLAFVALLTMAICYQAGAEPTALSNPSETITKLEIEPQQLVLHAANRQQQLLITARFSDGRIVDVTRQARVSTADSRVADIAGSAVMGRGDGRTELTISVDGVTVHKEAVVRGFATYPPVHFSNDVIPVLTKLGCNSGGCHGRASGQNGFKLSLYGFDDVADYESLLKQGRGRRLFPASPEQSLILTKPSGQVPHGGGLRLNRNSLDYQLLANWIDQGAPRGDESAPRLIDLQIHPLERQMVPHGQQQILATAVYSDGSLRDVSAAALYSSNAAHVAEVSPQGLVRSGQVPGEAAITVNYMGLVAAMQIQVPRAGAAMAFVDPPTHNELDPLVLSKLRKLGLTPSALADDATFLRRSTVDCLGLLPTSNEVCAFLADPSENKRARWIDRLLDRPEYADYWALKWADILLVDREKLGERGAFELFRWLRNQFATNRPYDQWVHELIVASGDSATAGPPNFYRTSDTPDALARAVSQAFLGVRIECAQCHHHPFEKWSQDDYYGLSAFFNGIELKPLGKDRTLVFHRGYRDMVIPFTERAVAAHALGAAVPRGLSDGDPRVLLADWLTDSKNPWFAKLAVNRLWKNFLGRGIVDPEDDLRSTNPPTNGELLDLLTRRLVESQFDLKAMMRLIMNSRTYQLASEPNENNRDDEQNFSHYYIKRLAAEPLLDSICSVTETPESFPGRPLGTRAMDLWDNRLPSYFLQIFGRPERTSPCECGRSSDPTIAQALHLMNAPEIESKVRHPHGRIARLVAAGASSDQIIEELCLATVGRYPREKDKVIARDLFASSTVTAAAEDFLWTLLNSYDFLFIR